MKKLSGSFFLFASILMLLFGAEAVYAQSGSAAANRQTALRCLQIAKEYTAVQAWDSAVSQIRLGLSYDDSIADLWYLLAAADRGKGESVSEILPVVETALKTGDWVDYNRNSARLLYAQLLSDTGRHQEASSILDEKPFIYSADAELIRIKTFYFQNTDTSLEKARDKIDAARRIYPGDLRFPELFFRHEHALELSGTQRSRKVQQTADAFIAQLQNLKTADAGLEIYASYFTAGEAHIRMLKAFSAAGLKHPVYALEALKAGLMTQRASLAYFLDFADTSVSYEILEQFIPLLTEDDVKKQFADYLTAYDGIITEDTDGDFEKNLTVKYLRGRPSELTWDKNNDGVAEWSAVCDFGAPQNVTLKNGTAIEYGIYPSVVKVSYPGKDGSTVMQFNMTAGAYSYAPFSMVSDKRINAALGCEFFYPEIQYKVSEPERSALFKSASSYELPSTENGGAVIRFTLLDGKVQSADYYRGSILYARASFTGGMPTARMIDGDGDGIFETVESIGYDADNTMHCSQEERNKVSEALLGRAVPDSKLYVKMIQVDQNEDTVPDFTEEYLPDNGKISSWDYDADGFWDVRYVRYPEKKGEPVLEDSLFYTVPEHVLVTISFVGGKPVRVTSGNEKYDVETGSAEGFYWIGTKGTPADEKTCIDSLNLIPDQGVCTIADTDTNRILTVKIGKKCFGRLLPPIETTDAENGKENENKQKL